MIAIKTDKFNAAVEFVLSNTHKELPDVLNRAALATIIGGKGVTGVMKRTPRATRANILAVPQKVIAGVVARKLKSGQLSLAGFGTTRREFKRLVRREYARRLSAIGYTANVGWNNAAMAFGGRGIGTRGRGEGWAQEGYGERATPGKLVATMVNTAPAAEKIGAQALQDAMDEVSVDMIHHTQERLQAIFNRANQ